MSLLWITEVGQLVQSNLKPDALFLMIIAINISAICFQAGNAEGT